MEEQNNKSGGGMKLMGGILLGAIVGVLLSAILLNNIVIGLIVGLTLGAVVGLFLESGSDDVNVE